MPKRPSKDSKLDALIKAHQARGPAGTRDSKPPGKSRNSEYAKLTIYIPRDLHTDLKIASVKRRQEMSEVVADLVSEWLKKEGGK